MGLLHAGILNSFDGIKITSVTEKEKMLTKFIQNAIPAASTYENYEEMITKEDLDVVYITTPSSSHFSIMDACIKKGTNFFVEKPLAINFEEAKKTCLALRDTKIIHGVGYNVRFVDTFSHAKSLLDMKVLGEIQQVDSSMFVSNIFSKPLGWRFNKKSSGGGVLLELGCHLVDLLLWYFGPISKVQSNMKKIYSEVEDFVHSTIELPNKIVGKLETSWSVEGYRIPEINIEITGTNGTMRINQDFIDIKLKKEIIPIQGLDQRIYKQSLERGVSFDVGGADYTKEDEHMISCIEEKKLPLVNVFEASKTQCVMQAMYDSAAENKYKEVIYVD